MDVLGITIDSKTTRDRDDAVWAEVDARGWTVTICIANVSAAISIGSVFDHTARRRAESSYRTGRGTPMLPRRFAEGSCSITEGQDRLVMAIRIRLDHAMDTQFVSVDESVLKSKRQLSYDDIPSILNDNNHDLHETVSLLHRLSNGLMEKRRKSGAFALLDSDSGWLTSEDGVLQRLGKKEEISGYVIVQELMILANTELAKFCLENEIPVPFRNHTARIAAPERLELLEKVTLGMHGSLAEFERVKSHYSMVMNKASYSQTLHGHYGLNLPAYLHGTSPIRRYADLVVQRQILSFVNGSKFNYNTNEISELSEHINLTLELRAKENAQAALERSNKISVDSIKRDELAHLSERDFEKSIKIAAGKELNNFVAEVFLNRLKDGLISVNSMYQILLRSDDSWTPVRERILDNLVHNTHQAMSIVSIASQIDGWSDPSFKMRQQNDDSVLHVAQAIFQKPALESNEVIHPNAKIARQRSVVQALSKWVGYPIDEWPDAIDKKNASCNNPVGKLMEYAQSAGAELPVYNSIENDGAFVISCNAMDMFVKSNPQQNKKTAKKQAASMMLKLIEAKDSKVLNGNV